MNDWGFPVQTGGGSSSSGLPVVAKGDLYDNFGSETLNPPPPAETGQAWAVTTGPFSTFYTLGLGRPTLAVPPPNVGDESYLLADSLRADARLRSRIIASTGAISCALVFRSAGGGFPSMEICFQSRDGGGGGGSAITLRHGRYDVRQTAPIALVAGETYDIDLTYVAALVTCTINGIAAFNYNVVEDTQLNTRVGFRQSETNYGAYGDGGDVMTYIWCSAP